MRDTSGFWFANRQFMWIYSNIGDSARAMKYRRNLYELAKTFPNEKRFQNFMEMSSRFLGQYFLNKDQLDSASFYLSQSYRIAKTFFPNSQIMSFSTSSWGNYHLKLQQYDSALWYYKLSNFYASADLGNDMIIGNHLAMAHVYLLKDKVDSAFVSANKALFEARSIPDTLDMIDAAKMVATVFEKTKQWDSAFNYLKKSEELQNRMAIQENKQCQ